jgi:hypothetical protein
MGRRCSICSHPNRDQIDSLIARNEGSAHGIARQFSLGKDAVLRHKAHIAPEIKSAQLAKFTDFEQLIDEVRKLSEKFDRMNRRPQSRESWDLFLAKSKNVREWIWLKTKMAGRIVVAGTGEGKSQGGDTYCVQFITPSGEQARIPLSVYEALPKSVFSESRAEKAETQHHSDNDPVKATQAQ